MTFATKKHPLESKYMFDGPTGVKDFPGCSGSYRQQSIQGDVHAEDAAPAIGAEDDRAGLQGQGG